MESYADRVREAFSELRAMEDRRDAVVKLARLAEDQPDPLARYDGHAGDLVPGYADSADGQADAADQRKADAR
jgi:hypothetical protein